MNAMRFRSLFTMASYSLAHGDLIIHNLLTDSEKLTGVLDWELALYGDSDYDLFRLYYYRECAAAYRDHGTDGTFEAEYMDMIANAIDECGLVADRDIFQRKYDFVRKIFYLNALDWDARSSDPLNNLRETIDLWHGKNRTCRQTIDNVFS